MLVVAKFAFEPRSPRELRLARGDIGIVVRKDSADWWTVNVQGNAGLVPAGYVAPAIGIARAMYPYKSRAETELDLAQGQIVILLQKVNDNWMLGHVVGQAEGKVPQGVFPKNYVQELEQEHLENFKNSLAENTIRNDQDVVTPSQTVEDVPSRKSIVISTTTTTTTPVRKSTLGNI